MSTLDPRELDWLGIRFLDRNGRVFCHDGQIYRAIYPNRVSHIRSLFERGIVSELCEKGLLIQSEITDLKVPGFGLVIKHETLPFVTKPWEWSRSFVRDAAICSLELNLELAKHGLSTDDGHGNNIGQAGACRPIWLDLGSINPITEGLNPAFEIRRCFTNPLRLLQRSSNSDNLMRQVIRSGGLDNEQLQSLLYERWHPRRLVNRVAAEWRRRARSDGDNSGRSLTPSSAVVAKSRIRYLQEERDVLKGLQLRSSWTTWGAYHPLELLPRDYASLPHDPRREAILSVLRQEKPSSVIDLAANAGFFSFFAARQGAKVLAVDYDENALERLYEATKTSAESLNLSCACYDLTQPPPLPRRAKMVLALALTHHLSISQAFPFSVIAERLSAYTMDSLLVEFMPNGLGGTAPKPDPLPDWYRLDAFLAALRTHFATVETINYTPAPSRSERVLILARGRRDRSSEVR